MCVTEGLSLWFMECIRLVGLPELHGLWFKECIGLVIDLHGVLSRFFHGL